MAGEAANNGLEKFGDRWFEEEGEKIWEIYGDERGIDFPERRAAKSLLTYWPPVFLLIGTLGNILSALILWKMLRKVLSTCLYVFLGVITDLVVLYIRCGNDWLVSMADLDIRHKAQHSSNSVCKIYPFVSDWTLHLSMWLSVAMAVETTLVTMRPQSLMRVCRQERGRAVILLIIVLLVCVNAHNFWTYALINSDKDIMYEEKVCTNARQGNQLSAEFRKIAWPIIDILVSDLLPICVCFSCSVMLITRRMRMADQLRQMENTWKAYSIDGSTARQLQLSFLVLALGHVILLLPKLGCEIFFFVASTDLNLVKFTMVLESKKVLAQAVCSTCLYVFLSTKIFVFLIISRTFRREFIGLLSCRACRRNNSGATNRVSTQQPLLSTVANSKHGPPHENCVNRKVFSTTSV